MLPFIIHRKIKLQSGSVAECLYPSFMPVCMQVCPQLPFWYFIAGFTSGVVAFNKLVAFLFVTNVSSFRCTGTVQRRLERWHQERHQAGWTMPESAKAKRSPAIHLQTFGAVVEDDSLAAVLHHPVPYILTRRSLSFEDTRTLYIHFTVSGVLLAAFLSVLNGVVRNVPCLALVD